MDDDAGKRKRRSSRVRRPVRRKVIDDAGIEVDWDEREIIDGPPDQEETADG